MKEDLSVVNLSKCVDYTQKGSSVQFKLLDESGKHSGCCSFTFIKENIVKITILTSQDNNKISLISNRPTASPNLHISRAEGKVVLKTEELTVNVYLDNAIFKIFNRENDLLLESNNTAKPVVDEFDFKPLGYSQTNGTIQATHCEFSLSPDEHFYGLGEKFLDFDRRGQRIQMWNHEGLGVRTERAYKNVPFFMSSKKYGVFVDSTFKVDFRLGSESTETFSIVNPTDELDMYVISGHSFRDILSEYTALAGRPPVPPKWSFGIWMSTGFLPATQRSVLKVAQKIRKSKLPVDVLHIDPYWMKDPHWTDFKWDTDAFPDPAKLLKQLHEMNFKLCLWINPYIIHLSPRFKEIEDKGFFLKTRKGSTYLYDVWVKLKPDAGMIDMTNPEAVDWFKDEIKKLVKIGVDTIKVDFGENIPADTYFHNGKTGKEMRNLYTLLYSSAVYEAIEEATAESGARPVIWCRSGTAGSQKYPTHWGGDPDTNYQGMASSLRGGLSLQLSGFGFWSHDIGGFFGKPTDDVYTRWAQFGMLTSHTRFHGTDTRYPWDYQTETEETVKKYMQLRYELIPFIYSYAYETSKTGIPIMRHMLLEYPDDPACHYTHLQYMFGRELLVAPVLSESNKKTFYLPEGQWVDYWTNDVLYGGTFITVQKPLKEIPLFVKADSIIPKMDKAEYVENKILDSLNIDIYLAKQATFLYQDDYETVVFTASQQEDKIIITIEETTKKLHIKVLPLNFIPTNEVVTFDVVESKDCQVSMKNGRLTPQRKFIELNAHMELKPARIVLKRQ